MVQWAYVGLLSRRFRAPTLFRYSSITGTAILGFLPLHSSMESIIALQDCWELLQSYPEGARICFPDPCIPAWEVSLHFKTDWLVWSSGCCLSQKIPEQTMF